MSELEVRNAANELFSLDGLDRIVMHRDWRTHDLTRMGKHPKPADPKRLVYSMFEAWLDLNCEYWTLQVVPGWGGNFQSLDLMPNAGGIFNAAQRWNWAKKDCKIWLDALLEQKIISENLYSVLVTHLGDNRFQWARRDQLPAKTRVQVLAKTNGKCVYCGVKLTTEPGHPNTYHADHVLPAKHGGSDDVANLIPSCQTCNTRKSAKTLLKFLGDAE